MTQHISDPPDTQSSPLSGKHLARSRLGILSTLAVIGVLLLLFSGQLAQSLILAERATPSGQSPLPSTVASSQSSRGAVASFTIPGHQNVPPLQLNEGRSIIYEQSNALYLVSSTGGSARVIPTPGFISSRATPPILMPGGRLLYSGGGIWMTDISGGVPAQIASLAAGQVITSMALSNDGKMLAWSTEPVNGSGMFVIYAGPPGDPSIVLQQPAQDCPCLRVFSFLNGTSEQADHTLLLTDDLGGDEAGEYGLWSLDLTQPAAMPQLILDERAQQAPLTLSAFDNALLYSTNEGAVPLPSNLSIPDNLVSLSYANDLNIGTLSGSPLALSAGQIILPEQDDLSNSAQYHWVTTPVFSPDGHTLAYVEFSSDGQPPYDRLSAIYTVSISGTGSQLHAGKPELLATSSNQLVELGPWLNDHILTIYADGTLYALDTQSSSMAVIAQPDSYATIVAVV